MEKSKRCDMFAQRQLFDHNILDMNSERWVSTTQTEDTQKRTNVLEVARVPPELFPRICKIDACNTLVTLWSLCTTANGRNLTTRWDSKSRCAQDSVWIQGVKIHVKRQQCNFRSTFHTEDAVQVGPDVHHTNDVGVVNEEGRGTK